MDAKLPLHWQPTLTAQPYIIQAGIGSQTWWNVVDGKLAPLRTLIETYRAQYGKKFRFQIVKRDGVSLTPVEE